MKQTGTGATLVGSEFGAPPPEASDWDLLGGELGLLAIISDFVDRVLVDVMIGFHFLGVDPARLKQREFEFARTHLRPAADMAGYSGRPLRDAHASHRILGGQFNRRLRILEQTLTAHGVHPAVSARWLRYNESLRSQITRDGSTECNS